MGDLPRGELQEQLDWVIATHFAWGWILSFKNI
jgi:hypothetical protein